MSADLAFPPGLGNDPETLRKSKEKNPRRRARKATKQKPREDADSATQAEVDAQPFLQTEWVLTAGA